ncbi:MAG: YHS domain-containing (seleno)protein [Pseudomonadota bacterium]
MMSVRNSTIGITFLYALTLIVVTFGVQSAANAKPAINTLGTPGLAIKGYDPVAYFEERRPRKGLVQFTLKHKGVEWRFSSAVNRARFQANPAKYEPAYGGYCAYGVSRGYLVKIEPDAWSIVNGRLYLNYNRQVRATWNKQPEVYIQRANANFSNLINK